MAKIAKLAGVSPATVCRVLRQSSLVKPATVSHVQQVMQSIGYVPQPPRNTTRRTGGRQIRPASDHARIALLTLGQTNKQWLAVPIIASFVASVTSEAREMDCDILLDEMPDPTEPSRLIQRREIDGVILLVDSWLTGSPEVNRAITALASELPVVWAMGGHVGDIEIDHILPDNLGVGHLAAKYLVDRQCKSPAFITISPRWALTRLRAGAFATTLHDAGLDLTTYIVDDEVREGNVFPGRVHVLPSLDDVARAIKTSDVKPDGVFLPRDYETARFHTLLPKMGLHPQRDLTIISCDNDPSQLSLMNPRPATIDLNITDVARRALRRLKRRIRHLSESPVLIQVPPRVVDATADVSKPESADRFAGAGAAATI